MWRRRRGSQGQPAPEEPAQELQRTPQLQEEAVDEHDITGGDGGGAQRDGRDERRHDAGIENDGLPRVQQRCQLFDAAHG